MRAVSMNRIQSLFRNKHQNILSVFYTAGFPNLNDTVRIGKALEDAGADLIEIGIPFSDPVADGPVIQASNKAALENGMNVKLLLSQVSELRGKVKLPVILMGYLNPVFQYGFDKFCCDAGTAGVDGIIIPDLPIVQYEQHYAGSVKDAGLSIVFLISPSTPEERIRRIDHLSDGFIYAVSASSTTGAKSEFSSEQLKYFSALKNMNLKNPIMVGFGISNAKTFKQVCEFASGAIVGSAFISMLNASRDIEMDVKHFVGDMRDKNQEN